MSPRRVFKGDPYRPDQLYGVAPTRDIGEGELTLFLQEAKKVISEKSYKLFERLSTLPPARRLSVNIKNMLDILGQRDVTDVLKTGLTQYEYDSLIELQVKDVPPRMKEIAHGLLCIDERSEFLQRMGSAFKDLITKKGGYIQNGSHLK